MVDDDVKKNVFKENWLKKDLCCEKCGQVTVKQKGLTKENLGRLFKIKFNMNELIFTFIIIMIIVLAWSYNNETKVCREWIGPMFESNDINDCKNVCNQKCGVLETNKGLEGLKFNFTNTITNETIIP